MALKQNIIYIYFKGKHLVTSKSQYQYNHGQFLYFADLDLPQAFEVHFSNKDKGYSKPQVGSNKLVEIPDEYYWSGAQMIYAWIYLHSDINDGETIYEVRIPLIKRAEPTDEQPLPQQESAMERAIAELNNAVEITTENANKTGDDRAQVSDIRDEVVDLKENIDATAVTVEQKAQDAIDASRRSETSAQNAAEFEEGARRYSEDAGQSAQEALESKNIAKQKAQVATDASAEAKDFRDEAETFKNEAEQAKQNIVDYRDETKGYRDEALTAKDDVQTIKGDVQLLKTQIDDTADNVFENAREAYQSMISADNASLSASESAENASQSANKANQSATNASESANQAEEFKNQSEEYKTQAGAFKSQAETFKNQAEEFKNQTETNVTHYPKIIGEYWYVWDATNGEYINTNVDANGIKGDTGRGIASIALNDDYTLTITFTDDTTYTTSSIRGQQGEKGDTGKTGESGVYIGTEEPENEDIKVWIDTDDDGTSEDLVADIADLQETNKKILNTYPTKTVSGAIATFDDSVDGLPLENLTVDINPVQNLNGYDHPWVGGSGKNLCNPHLYTGIGYNPTVGTVITLKDSSLQFTQSSDGVFSLDTTTTWKQYSVVLPIDTTKQYRLKLTFSSTGTAGLSRGYLDANYTVLTDYNYTDTTVNLSLSLTPPENAAYYYIVFSNRGTASTTLTVTKPQLEIGTESTDYAPYENICPISGWEGMQLNHTDENLLGGIDFANAVKASMPSAVIDTTAKTVTFTGTTDGNANKIISGGVKFKEDTQYTFINIGTTGNIKNVRWVYTNGTTDGSSASKTGAYTSASGKTVLALVKINNASNAVVLNYEDCGIFEGVLTVDDFKPYVGQTIPISWQSEVGTVYGGQLDVLNGVLTITHDFINLGNLTWNYRSDRDCFESKVIPKAQHSNNTLTITCDCFTPVTNRPSETKLDNIIYFNSTSGVRGTSFRIRCTSLNGDVEAFKELITGHYATYLMYTTDWIETQLTPHEIDSLLGQNNIWADTGNSYVTYRVDPQKYINEQISEIPVQDVQINDVSIVQDGVAKIPTASENNAGVVKVDVFTNGSYEGGVVTANNKLYVVGSSLNSIKSGWDYGKPIVAGNQHMSTFYGLAKAAGHDEKDSELPVGQYTEEAKTSIQNMLDVPSKNDVANSLAEVANIKSDVITDTASGAVVSFSDGADNLPLKSIVVDINPVQDLHGYDSPWVGGGGKNKINAHDITISSGSYLYNGALALPAGTYTISFTSSSGASTSASLSITDADGTAMVTGSHVIPYTFTLPNASAFVKIYVSGAGTYTNIQIEEGSSATSFAPYENICPISGWTGMTVNASGKNLLDPTLMKDQVAWNVIPFYAPVGTVLTMSTDCDDATTATGLPVYFRQPNSSQGAGNNVKASRPITQTVREDGYVEIVERNPSNTVTFADFHWQIEVGSTVTPYEPYNGQTVPISWQTEAGTVYGGKLDVLRGLMRIEWADIDLATLSGWANNMFGQNAIEIRCTLTGKKGGRTNIISNMLKTGTETSATDSEVFSIRGYPTSSTIAVKVPKTVAQDSSEVVTWIANNHPMACYELAEPIEIQLTPTEVRSLLGQNNIFTDTGNTEVEYRADTKLYINKKITEAISALT